MGSDIFLRISVVYHAEPYCGTSTKIPITGNVVVGLVDACLVGPGNYLYIDNLFTSLTLLDEPWHTKYI